MSHNNIETMETEQINEYFNKQTKSIIENNQKLGELSNKLSEALLEEYNEITANKIKILKDEILSCIFELNKNFSADIEKFLIYIERYLGEIDKLKTEIKGLRDEADTINAQNKALAVENEGLKARAVNFETEINGLRNEADTINTQNEALAIANEGLKARAVSFETEINTLNSENEKLRGENEELKTIYKKIEEDSILSVRFNYLKQKK